MSGSEAGKQASHCCVVSFLSDYYSTSDSWSVKHAGQKILSATNSWLYSQGQSRYESTKGMVSTLSIIVLKSTTAHIFHIGDSRIYRLRQGNFEQITRDHRIWVKEKNYLNRAMGIEPHLEVDYLSLPLETGDLFLMTTDGIHDFIDEKTLKKLAQDDADLTQVAAQIMQQASDNHSDDNLTCQLVRIDELPEANEDEAAVRRYATRVLRGGGYQVLEAGSGKEALGLAGGHPGPIDLLFTDVVMPGMSGPQLAQKLTSARPGLRVLYTSGYAASVIEQHGVLDERFDLVEKPIAPHALLAKVRELLDRDRPRAADAHS